MDFNFIKWKTITFDFERKRKAMSEDDFKSIFDNLTSEQQQAVAEAIAALEKLENYEWPRVKVKK